MYKEKNVFEKIYNLKINSKDLHLHTLSENKTYKLSPTKKSGLRFFCQFQVSIFKMKHLSHMLISEMNFIRIC